MATRSNNLRNERKDVNERCTSSKRINRQRFLANVEAKALEGKHAELANVEKQLAKYDDVSTFSAMKEQLMLRKTELQSEISERTAKHQHHLSLHAEYLEKNARLRNERNR